MMKNIRYFLIVMVFGFSMLAPLVQAKEPTLVFEVKNTEQGVKLRWMVTDRQFDYTYVLWRAPANQPEQKEKIAQLQILTFEQAKPMLKNNKAGLKLMFPFETAKDRAELNASLSQNDNRLSMLVYLSVMQPDVAKALGQYYEDKPPAEVKAVVYTLEVYRGKEVLFSQNRGVDLTRQPKMPMLWNVKAHRFDWGVGLKWQGYEAYTMFNIYRANTYEGPFKKINKGPVQVQASKNPDGTLSVAPYFYSDTSLKEGQLFFYKVQGVDFFADDGPLTLPVLGKLKIDPHPTVLARPTVEAGETSIDIHWSPAADKDIVGYNVYRSQKYDGVDDKLNEHLLIGTFFRDTTVQVDLNYFYSVTAVNKGGYESLRSLNALGLAKDVTPPPVVQGLVGELGEVEEATIKLHWNGVTAKDLLGYQVYRTMRPDNQDWSLITEEPVAEPLFADVLTKNLSRHPYYYRITTIDTHFNESAPSVAVKVQLPDVTPPQRPSITGSSVRAGQVALTWSQVQVYDLAGFYVYREVNGHTLKVSQNMITQPSFVDATPPVNKPIIYTVVAVDKTGNESAPSSSVNLSVRDHVKPRLSSFKAGVEEGQVVLTVISKDTDLAGFDVFRSHNNRDFLKISHTRIKESRFVDSRVKQNKRYFYKIILWDTAANKTESVVRQLVVK